VAVPWVLSGRRLSVAGPLGPVWLPWGVADLGAPYGRCEACRFFGVSLAAVGARPARKLPSGRRWCVAVPLCPVWPPWVFGRSPGPRLAAMGTWPA